MDKRNPKVSIGLPVFNGEFFLGETLESLLVQSYQDFDVLISDNASTDGTSEICQSYAVKDNRIKYHRNDSNLGAAANYNIVFHQTGGEYFKWMAYDDPIAPDFLEKCVHVLDSNLRVTVCYSQTLIINEYGQIVEKYSDGFHLNSPEPHMRFKKIITTYGLCNPIFGLIRREVLKHTPLIGDYPYSDRKLLAELSLYGDFFEIPELLFYRREHPLVSTRVNSTETALAEWYNPDSRNKLILPVWRRYFEYLTAILHAPISASNKLYCFYYLIQLASKNRRWRVLHTDILRAIHKYTIMQK